MARNRVPYPRDKKSGGFDLFVDDSDVATLIKSLRIADSALRKNTNTELREAAKECGLQLRNQLIMEASAVPAPQAKLVASAIRVKSDRFPVVQVGGPKKVGRPYKSRSGGRKRAPAGALLWGVEYGDRFGRFASRNANGYWLQPTVIRFSENKAIDIYKTAVIRIFQNAGVL